MHARPRRPVHELTNRELLDEVRRTDTRARRPCVVCGRPAVGLQCDGCRATPRAQPDGGGVSSFATSSEVGKEEAPVVGVRRVRLPWSVLVPDNRKHQPARDSAKGGIMLTPEYRQAKERAKAIVAQQLQDAPPLTGDVRLEARVYLPNLSRARDVANLSKLVHDVLSGLAYGDDRQIAKTTWERAGVDVDAPRCELTITSLVEASR